MSERNMSEVDTQFAIGKLATENAQRDAIHIAVAPVKASEDMAPGDRIGFTAGNTLYVSRTNDNPIGIVDPFIKGRVKRDQRFYMFIMPNTITSLRHQWTHPGFTAPSEEWLRAFAAEREADYEEMVRGAISGGGCCFGRDIDYGDFGAHSEFWTHIEVVSGKTLTDDHKENTAFRCAC